MALFGNKTKDGEDNTQETTQKETQEKKTTPASSNPTLLGPYVTEKAALLSDEGIYTFKVRGNSTKREIAKAVQDVYGVTPTKVRTVRLPHKVVMRRSGPGVKRRPKKAYVHLKEGDSIELF